MQSELEETLAASDNEGVEEEEIEPEVTMAEDKALGRGNS